MDTFNLQEQELTNAVCALVEQQEKQQHWIVVGSVESTNLMLVENVN